MIIEVSGLTYEYDGREVLHDISFAVQAGTVTALVGPNGAGKTTLLRCLAALERPVAGSVTIDSLDAAEHPRRIHSMTGYLSDFFGLYNRLTVRQCFLYTAECHAIPDRDISARVAEIAQAVDIVPYLDQPAATLSRGYRQRLGIGLALVNNPKILLLDEPASGMDPEARIGLSGLMLSLRARGITIIVSSHILAELEDYCTDMLVIRDGRIADHVKLEDFRQQARSRLRVNIPGAPADAAAVLSAQAGVTSVRANGDWFEFDFSGAGQGRAALLKFMIDQGWPVAGFETGEQTLQAAYMNLADKEKTGGASP